MVRLIALFGEQTAAYKACFNSRDGAIDRPNVKTIIMSLLCFNSRDGAIDSSSRVKGCRRLKLRFNSRDGAIDRVKPVGING